MRRWRRLRGITLIEMLLAITLVGMLSAGILYAFRIGINTMERASDRFLSNRRVLGAERVLEQQIAGLMPVAANCGARPGPFGAGGVLFFQGLPSAMRFVSRYTLEEAARGYPRVLEYLVIPGEQNQGVRLVVNELLYTGPSILDQLCVGSNSTPFGPVGVFVPIRPHPRSFVLADKLAFCRISYLLVEDKTGLRTWSPAFSGPLPPAAIRFEMQPLSPDPSRLQMTSLLLPVRANRDTRLNYVDIDQPQQ